MRFLVAGLFLSAVAASACGGTASSPAANASTAEPAAADVGQAHPAEKMVTIPAGTTIPIVLETAVGSATSRIEQPVHAHLARAIAIDGVTALADGSAVAGVVTAATRSGKVKGLAHVSVRFDSVTAAGGSEYQMQTSAVGQTAANTKDRDALEIAAPAVGGAIIGGLVGGGKGVAIGAAAGGGGGTAVVLSTRGKEVSLRPGARLTLRLLEPLTVRAGG